jgi:hypothetical protein
VWTLPDLAGQPGWVVAVVTALFTAGSLGAAWLRRRSPGGELEAGENSAQASEPDAGAVPSLPSAAQDGATLTLHRTLDFLAAEAAESREARAEAAQSRKELGAVQADLNRLTAEHQRALERLVRCEARNELLEEQARGRRGNT